LSASGEAEARVAALRRQMEALQAEYELEQELASMQAKIAQVKAAQHQQQQQTEAAPTVEAAPAASFDDMD